MANIEELVLKLGQLQGSWSEITQTVDGLKRQQERMEEELREILLTVRSDIAKNVLVVMMVGIISGTAAGAASAIVIVNWLMKAGGIAP